MTSEQEAKMNALIREIDEAEAFVRAAQKHLDNLRKQRKDLAYQIAYGGSK